MRFTSRLTLIASCIAGLLLAAGCASDSDATDKGLESKTEISAADKPQTAIKAIDQKSAPRGGVRSSQLTLSENRTSAPLIDDNRLTAPAVLISGRITFQDGRPATSASVELKASVKENDWSYKQKTLSTAVTDDSGNYQVRGDGEAIGYELDITGDLPSTLIRLDKEISSNNNRVKLRRVKKDIVLTESFDVTGRVLDDKGQPMPGLAVNMVPKLNPDHAEAIKDTRLTEARATTSTATGDFSLNNIAAGQWHIGAAAPEYAAVIQQVDIPSTTPITLQFSSRGGTINGHVYLKADSSPVNKMPLMLNGAGLRLPELEKKQTVSASDGSFKFEHVSSGSLTIFIDPEVVEEKQLGLAKPLPGKIEVAEKETTEVVVFLYPGHTLSGQVFDKDTSDPLSGAAIRLLSTYPVREAKSDEAGKYRLDHVFAGERTAVSLTAQLDGYSLSTKDSYNKSLTVMIPEDADHPVNRDLPMIRQVTISGKVVTRDEMPVPYATVRVVTSRDFGRSAKTTPVNSDGTFKLYGDPFSSVMIEAQASGLARTTSDMIELTTEDVKDVKVVMDVGAVVEGVVTEPGGGPSAGAKVQNLAMYNFPQGGYGTYEDVDVTGEDGKFIMRDAPKKVQLMASKKPFAQSEQQTLELKGGETRSGVELQLRQGHVISGRVVNKDKAPITGVNVNAQGDGSYGNETSDKDGNFKIEGLAEGIYRVYAYGNGTSKNLENIKADTTDLEIILDKTTEGGVTLIGTVIDDLTEEPVRDFEINYSNSRKLPEAGKFEYSGLNAGTTYNISISSAEHDSQSYSVEVPPNVKTFNKTFRLGKSGVITGRVIEKSTGQPVPNVIVLNWGSTQSYERGRQGPSNHTTTGEDGRFVLAPAPSGENTIQAKPAAPMTEVSKTVTVKSGDTADAGDIEISAGGTIKGQVLRGASDEPVPDKQVKLNAWQNNNQLSKTTTTDADGRFEFTGLPATNMTLSCGSVQKSVTIGTTQSGGSTENVVLRLGGVKMSGKVLRGGQPVQASVSASGSDNQSFSTYAQNGNYSISDILPGTYEFTVGNYPTSIHETVQVPDQAEFEKDFTLPNGQIHVTVVNAAGEPVSNASISLSQKSAESGYDQKWLNRSSSVYSKSDGTYTYDGLTPGVYSVSARKEEDGTAMNPAVTVQDGQSQEVRLELSSNGGTLVSVALNSADGQGLQNAWCYLYGPNGSFTHSAKRDASGVMTIKNIPPGTYTTNVSYWSFSQAERSIEIKAGETATIEDVLYPAGAITWTLRRADGKAAEGATVALTPIATNPEDHPRNGKTSNAGQYVERGLAPGTYQATAQLPGKPAITENFEVGAGANATKETVVPGW